jgi:hypothetical protein
MAPFGFQLTTGLMNQPDQPAPSKGPPEPKPSRSEEARRIIEEYVADLREVIKKLRRHFN